jgi:uncharacterized protein YecE (DUF72 family)
MCNGAIPPGENYTWPKFGYFDSMNGKVHIGTSGWSYKDWIGIFYPKKMKPADWLSHYARTFDCTEINGSFYRLPTKQTVINWVDKVPKKFKFCPKMSRFLTHLKKLRDPEEPLQRFFSIFEPMRKKMGPVLIQLPKIVRFDYEITKHFYQLLKEKYSPYHFAIEVRHESWMTEASYSLMTEFGVAFVISHSGDHFPYAEVVTAKNIYFRFHGPGTLYNTKYHSATLKKYSRLFNKWQEEGRDLWIFFNNDWFGYGIENALTLRKFLEQAKQPVPVD